MFAAAAENTGWTLSGRGMRAKKRREFAYLKSIAPRTLLERLHHDFNGLFELRIATVSPGPRI
jgi:hypothetical protein